MKSAIGLFTIALLLVTCTDKKENAVESFKNYVGEENFYATDYFLASMEKKLEKTYQTGSIKTDINKYLNETAKGKSSIKFVSDDCDAYKLYELNGMLNKFQKEDYDTVYFQGDYLITKDGDNWSEELLSMDGRTREEIVRKKNEDGYNKLVHYGKLLGGLEHIGKKDTLIYQYVELKKNIGTKNSKNFAKNILKYKIDFSENYFYRLIILNELYYQEIKTLECY